MNSQKRIVTAVNISVLKYSFTIGLLCQMPLVRSGGDDLSPPPTKTTGSLMVFFSFFVFVYPVIAHTQKSISKYTSKIPRSHPDSKSSRSCFCVITTLSLTFMFFLNCLGSRVLQTGHPSKTTSNKHSRYRATLR